MDKTPDVAQLSTCCGKPLVWNSTATESAEVDGWGGRCPSCGMEWAELATPARMLLPTEQMLLARIAALEDAQRWRVTAAEMPPVGVDVLGWWDEGYEWPHEVARWDGYQWWAEGGGEDYSASAPTRWLPIPGAPKLSQGADVPKEA